MTENVWAPRPKPLYAIGELQRPYGAPSSEHSNWTGSSAEKVNRAVVWSTVAIGPPSMVTTGRARTVQVWLAGETSMTSRSVTARTSSVCSPKSELKAYGVSHELHTSASSLHSNPA